MSLGFEVEDVLLWAALATGVAAFLAAAFHVRGQGRVHFERAQKLAQVSASFLTINLLLMVYYFITTELRIEYVHAYTHAGAPLAYRIAGLWGGQKGTLLLWGTFSALALVVNQAWWNRAYRRGHGRAPDPGGAQAWTLMAGLAIVAALTLLMLLARTWARTDPYLLALRPDGFGLQPVLRTPFMVIHPPLQFLGYALTTLLFAAGISGLATGDRHWADIAIPWTRLAFLVQFAGLGLGGLWAYYVLNFGGYWAWDPVETANLIAFFPTLLLLHALIYYRKRRMFQATAPLFALLTFPSVLFSTIATRSGLWISVHAFTDPSRNFARDPLQRFLNILQVGGIELQVLTGLFLASLLAAILAYLWSLQRAHPHAPTRWTSRLVPLAFFLAATLLALSLLDPQLATSALFELSHRAWPANAAIGLAIVLLAATLLLAAPTFLARDEPTKPTKPPLERWVNTPNLVFLGMLFVTLAWLVTFLLDVMSVNGYQREAYDERAPLLALPILLLLGLALGHTAWGKKNALRAAAAALLLGVLGVVVAPSAWQVALVLPPLLYALAGSATKLYKVSDPGRQQPARLRLAGALLLFGGIAGLTYWANAPTRIPLPGLTLYPGAWWAAWGIPASLLSLLGGVATLRAQNHRLAILGALGLTLSLAWIIATPVGLLALALILAQRNRFANGQGRWDLAATLRSLQREYRKTGTYTIHVCLVLGLLGYATSTYLQPADETLTLTLGETQTAHGYEFALAGTTHGPLDPDQGILTELTAHLEIRKDGRYLSDAPLTMWLELREHYAERVRVERYAHEDLYLGGAIGQFRPVRFTVQQGDEQITFNAHDDNVRLHPGAQVLQVFFTIRTLPGMHLVWGGLWGVTAGLLLVLAFGGFRFEARDPQPVPPSTPGGAAATTVK